MAILATRCELWANNKWNTISIEDALEKFPQRKLRCTHCQGQVRPHRQGKNGEAAHFEHVHAFPGCSQSHSWDHRPEAEAQHPKALR